VLLVQTPFPWCPALLVARCVLGYGSGLAGRVMSPTNNAGEESQIGIKQSLYQQAGKRPEYFIDVYGFALEAAPALSPPLHVKRRHLRGEKIDGADYGKPTNSRDGNWVIWPNAEEMPHSVFLTLNNWF